mmetsp:Transcript_2335/g.6924  ORF Transcript_2335/g.6924 Transcript_2335/m.6924 type:complete len:296 (-) Transcript_2335:142-1029(-)
MYAPDEFPSALLSSCRTTESAPYGITSIITIAIGRAMQKAVPPMMPYCRTSPARLSLRCRSSAAAAVVASTTSSSVTSYPRRVISRPSSRGPTAVGSYHTSTRSSTSVTTTSSTPTRARRPRAILGGQLEQIMPEVVKLANSGSSALTAARRAAAWLSTTEVSSAPKPVALMASTAAAATRSAALRGTENAAVSVTQLTETSEMPAWTLLMARATRAEQAAHVMPLTPSSTRTARSAASPASAPPAPGDSDPPRDLHDDTEADLPSKGASPRTAYPARRTAAFNCVASALPVTMA